jgi:glutamate dehydrogenase (NAD(P)+)
VSIQGFGAVGTAEAARFADLGSTIVAVSASRGVLCDPTGLDVAQLLAAHAEHGDDFVTRFDGGASASSAPAGSELTVDCDVLVPAALQDVIDDHNVHQIKARLIVEGANLPTSPSAQAVLAERGVTVVPDFIANAGGVIAAAFAMDARYSAFRPDTDAVFSTITDKLRANTRTVLGEAARQQITPHTAGRRLAEDRVRAAMQSKGRLSVR